MFNRAYYKHYGEYYVYTSLKPVGHDAYGVGMSHTGLGRVTSTVFKLRTILRSAKVNVIPLHRQVSPNRRTVPCQ